MDPDPECDISQFVDFVFAAAASTDEMPEVRVVTLSHFAFETEYPKREVIVQPQMFCDNDTLSIALDIDLLDEFTYESVLQALLNLSEDVSLNDLHKPCYFGRPVVMRWHDDQQQYVRGLGHVAEQTAV